MRALAACTGHEEESYGSCLCMERNRWLQQAGSMVPHRAPSYPQPAQSGLVCISGMEFGLDSTGVGGAAVWLASGPKACPCSPSHHGLRLPLPSLFQQRQQRAPCPYTVAARAGAWRPVAPCEVLAHKCSGIIGFTESCDYPGRIGAACASTLRGHLFWWERED